MSLSNEQIVDAIAAKSLMEVMELVKAIGRRSSASPPPPRSWPSPLPAGRCRREQTEFILKSAGDKKVEGDQRPFAPSPAWA